MRILAASILFASVALTSIAYGQSPIQVKYCQDMTAVYRKSISEGKSPISGVSQAAVNCPTNPGDSISVLEAALKEMKVDLPSR
jgi:hypothetical protein